MPSIQDVADQINAKLDEIEVNTQSTADRTGTLVNLTGDIKSELQQANARLNSIDGNLTTGFSNLSQGLFLLSELEKVSIGLLDHHRKQNDTIICLLENSNEMLCGITRKLSEQLDLGRANLRSTERIEGILERVHAEQAADYDRHEELQDKIAECCPEDQAPPEPCPEACKTFEYKPGKPSGTDWKPLPDPKHDDIR